MPIGPFGLQPPQDPFERFRGPLQPMPTGGTLENVLSSSQGVSDLFGTMRKDSEEEPVKIKTETDPVTGEPKMSVEGLTQKAWSAVMDALSFKARAVAGMQQHADMLAEQEARARANPLLHVLSTVAGNLAVSDPRLPPLVSALGRSSLALNPTPDQIAARRMGVEAQIGKTASEAAGLAEGLMTHQETIAHHRALEKEAEGRLAETIIQHNADLEQKYGKAEQGKIDKALQSARLVVEKGDGTPMSANGFIAHMQAQGVKDPVKINDAYLDHLEQANIIKNGKEAALQGRKELAAMVMGPRLQDKADQDKAIEEAAQALAKMDRYSINTLSQISGMFGGGRLKIFARARELNPKFNTAQLERMKKMEESFTVGKDGQQLQSFGTFLEHAGDLKDVYDKLGATRIPVITKTWNWLRQNAGKPEVARVLAALDPVKKEFESFLLNNRALYVVDRQTVDKIISEFQSPAQMFAAVQQMGHTVKARYNEISNRYQQTMGENLTDAHPFTDEAIDAAKKIGVTLPKGASSADPLGVLK